MVTHVTSVSRIGGGEILAACSCGWSQTFDVPIFGALGQRTRAYAKAFAEAAKLARTAAFVHRVKADLAR